MKSIIDEILTRYRQAQFTSKKQETMLEDLANLLEDGVSVNVALDLMTSFARSDVDLEVIRQMQLKMTEGESFVLGMDGWCKNNIVEMIRAGEEGGTLVEAIRMAADNIRGQNEAISALLSGLTYPLSMFCATLVMLVYIASTVMPNFIQIKPVADWPAIGQSALGLANFVKYYWWAIILGIVASVIGVRTFMGSYIGDFRIFLDKIPPFTIYRNLSGARLMETLGLLIRNGVILKQALKILQRSAPPYLYSHLLMMEYRLSGGRDNIADVLDTGLIDQQDLARLRVVALGKGFDEALTRQGKRSMAKSVNSIKLAGKIMGGLCMAGSAGLLGFIFYAIYAVGLSIGGT